MSKLQRQLQKHIVNQDAMMVATVNSKKPINTVFLPKPQALGNMSWICQAMSYSGSLLAAVKIRLNRTRSSDKHRLSLFLVVSW